MSWADIATTNPLEVTMVIKPALFASETSPSTIDPIRGTSVASVIYIPYLRILQHKGHHSSEAERKPQLVALEPISVEWTNATACLADSSVRQLTRPNWMK